MLKWVHCMYEKDIALYIRREISSFKKLHFCAFTAQMVEIQGAKNLSKRKANKMHFQAGEKVI